MNRSDINLLSNSTSGTNVGNGTCIFKCKDVTGNTLQFKTISVAGSSLSIITGDTTITICGAGGTTISGATDYIPKFNGTSNNIVNSSILDSGSTNMHIFKQKIIGRCNTIGLVATNAAYLGTTNNCIISNGISLCSGTYCNLSIVAGSCVSSGCAGKALYLCGGAGTGAVGGNIVICAGTGNTIGRVQTPNLPVKSTETCAVYIDASGNLSKGIVGTGSTTIIGGTANSIPVFNSTGNNIQNSTLQFTGSTLYNSNNLIIKAQNNCNLYLVGTCGPQNIVVNLGYTSLGTGFTTSNICVTGQATNIDLIISTKGTGQLTLSTPTSSVNIGTSGKCGLVYSPLSCTLTLPQNARIKGYGGNGVNANAPAICFLGGDAYSQPTYTGTGGTVYICGGSASGTILKVGGNIVIAGGAGAGGGANGRISLTGLLPKTSETCVVYIDSTGKLSTGISSGSTGGSGITGATNGICLYNSKNVCLGGTVTSLITLTATGATNGLNLCSINGCTNKTSVCSGLFTTCTYNPVTSFCGCIINCGQITLTSKNSSTCNYTDITPSYAILGNTNNYICTTATNIAMYSMAGTACLNTFTAGGTQIQAFAGDPVASKFAMTTWSSVTPSVCLAAVNATCSVEMCIMPNSLTVHGCATFQGIQYIVDYSANYIARSLVDCGYVNTKFAPICNPIFTGILTAPVIKLTTGAAVGCVLKSAADGTASWGTPSSGGLAWQGSTANGIGTYLSAGLICSQPNMTFNGTNLGITGTIIATSTITATDFIMSSDEILKTCIEPIIISRINVDYKQFNFINEPTQLRYGAIANLLQKDYPELVRTGNDGTLGVSYNDLFVREIAYLKNKVNELELIVNKLIK